MSNEPDKESANGFDSGGRRRAAREWLELHWRALLSELVSTSMLLGLGCASCLPKPNAEREPAPLVHPALSFGFLVTALCVAFGEPSGCHMNPAVSLAAVLMQRMSVALALAFSVTQVLGATLGYWLLAVLAPSARDPPMGMTLPGDEISVLGALLLELAMTALLVMTVCALWVSPPDPTGPIKVGMLVGGLTLAGGWMSGTSLNPARSIGPVIYHNYWKDHWVYWAGPLLGTLAGVGLHAALHPVTAPCRRPPAPSPSPAGPVPPDMLDGDSDDEQLVGARQPSLARKPFAAPRHRKQPSSLRVRRPSEQTVQLAPAPLSGTIPSLDDGGAATGAGHSLGRSLVWTTAAPLQARATLWDDP